MNSRRSDMEIYIDILRLALPGPAFETVVMERANLNFLTLKRCIKVLHRRGLLRNWQEGWHHYLQTTIPDGRDAVMMGHRLRKLFE